jgi:hypothetical protein
LRNPKTQIPDTFWYNLLGKFVTQKGCFSDDYYYYYYYYYELKRDCGSFSVRNQESNYLKKGGETFHKIVKNMGTILAYKGKRQRAYLHT